MGRRSKKEELVSKSQLDDIKLATPEQLKEIIVNATKNRAAQKRMLKDDKDIVLSSFIPLSNTNLINPLIHISLVQTQCK